MKTQEKKELVPVKLVTSQARKLETKTSLTHRNPYTTDWTDMSDITRRELQLRPLGTAKS